MSLRENIYKNALKALELIYTQSKYDPEVDLFRSFDVINAVNDTQFSSKEWLVEKLLPHLPDNTKRICILGSWYGLVSIILRKHLSEDVIIRNIDSDPKTEMFGWILCKNIKKINSDNTQFLIEDAVNHFMVKRKSYQVIINTSCEHMEYDDITDMTRSLYFDEKVKSPKEQKEIETIICLQTNNYHSVKSHINTYKSLDDFVNHVNLNTVLYTGTHTGINCDRYMIIGK